MFTKHITHVKIKKFTMVDTNMNVNNGLIQNVYKTFGKPMY